LAVSDDFQRFAIDPDEPFAADRLALAEMLVLRGTPVEAIAEDSGLIPLQRRMWAHIFVGTDELVPLAVAAKHVDLDVADAEEVVRLLGLPIAEDARMALDDVDLLKTFRQLTSVFGEEAARQITRTIGASMARIAEALVSTTRVGFETPVLEQAPYADFVRLAGPLVEEYFPRLALVMDRVFRYHIFATSGQAWGVDEETSAMTITRAVGFADMVGFTTEAGNLSTRGLTEMIDRFEGRVSESIGKRGGRAVKFIGDEVFFSFIDPNAACACALDLLELADDKTMPDVRVGIAYGEIVARSGDYYGPVVNLASRLVDVAEAGTALVSDELARQATAFTFEELEPRELKGVGTAVSYAKLTRS
jgi:class 3 adenylate cyclase